MTKPTLARIFRGTPRNLAFLAGRLRAGDLVGVPTETVYGLAANALDPAACAGIFRAKDRPRTDPLIVHVHSISEFRRLCVVNESALVLAGKFWPGPLTLVLPKTGIVPDIVTSGQASVAVRMPAHPLFRRLLARTGLPLAAPSANPFGYVSPTTAEHVRDGLGRRIRYILDGGAAPIGLESTIVDLREPGRPRLLRPGAITRQQLETALGRKIRPASGRSPRQPGLAQVAPGMLPRHYSPRTPVSLHRKIDRIGPTNEAFVFLGRPARPLRNRKNVFWLDAKGSLPGAARRLFSMLRRLDRLPFARIHVELAGGGGLAEAINDRLRRAARR